MWCRSSVGGSDRLERSAASSSTSLRARRRRRAWLCLCETAASRHNDEDRGLGGHSDRETQRGSDVPPPTRAAGPWRTQNLLSALSSTAARAGLRRRLRARRTITPHRCEAPSLSAGPGPEARARVRRRTSAVDDPGRRRDVARHRRDVDAPRRRPLTSANEPDEFFASDFESMAPEEKLKDPLVLLGLGSIFLPFVMILLFQATGVI